MKKILAGILCLCMITAMLTTIAFAEGTATNLVYLDYGSLTDIASGTLDNAKYTLTKGAGWLSDTDAIEKDGEISALHFKRTDNALHGFDVNTIKNVDANSMVFTMKLKCVSSTNAAFFLKMINDKSWFCSVILHDGKMYVDNATDNNFDKANTSTFAADFSLGVYHLVSVVYNFKDNKQVFYLDGNQVALITGYRNGGLALDSSPKTLTRFKFEAAKQDFGSTVSTGNCEYWFKEFTLYAGSIPREASDLNSLKTQSETSLRAYVDINDYRADDKVTINGIIDTNVEAINKATSTDAIIAILDAAHKAIDAILTDEEKTAAEELAKKVSEGKTLLQNLVNLEDYEPDVQAEINEIRDEAYTKLDSAVDAAEANKIATIAKNKILSKKKIGEQTTIKEEVTENTTPETKENVTDDKKVENSGCGSAITSAFAMISLVSLCGVSIIRKKH